MDTSIKTIDIIVPCYNEEDVLRLFYEESSKVTDNISNYSCRYIFVDDGSRDKTLSILMELANEHKNVNYISFSRNFGKEAAMYAGLDHSTGDYVVIMDADLQHPPTMIPQMIEGVEEGYDCCAARRTTRKGEAPIRSFFSRMFYKVNRKITNIDLVQGAVDFRIMTRQMVDSIISMKEYNRYTKGMFGFVGFETKWLEYDAPDRAAGKSKFNLFKLIKYAFEGIVAFSTSPLITSAYFKEYFFLGLYFFSKYWFISSSNLSQDYV